MSPVFACWLVSSNEATVPLGQFQRKTRIGGRRTREGGLRCRHSQGRLLSRGQPSAELTRCRCRLGNPFVGGRMTGVDHIESRRFSQDEYPLHER